MLESSCYGLTGDLGIIARLGFGGRNIADGLEETPVVEPVHPFEGSELDRLGAAPGLRRRPPPRQSLARRLPQSRRLPARGPRRAADVLAIQIPSMNAKSSGPPMPSSDASARSGAEPDPWASSPIAPQWAASCSPSFTHETATMASAPSPADTNVLTLPRGAGVRSSACRRLFRSRRRP